MPNFKPFIVLVLCVHLVVCSATAQRVVKDIELDNSPVSLSPNRLFAAPPDSTGQLNIERILQSPPTFTKNTFLGKRINIKNDVYWFKMRFQNTQSQASEQFVSLGYASLIDVYVVNQAKQIIEYNTEGTTRPLKQRKVTGVSHVMFSFVCPAQQTVDIYIKTRCIQRSPLWLQPEVISKAYKQHQKQNTDLFQGIFQGLLWMIMFYSFFMFLSIKDRAYLHYVAYTISMSLFFLYTQQYLVYYIPFFSNNPSKTMYFSILLYVAFVAYYKLMRRFTNVEEKRPRLNHWLKIWIKVYYVITLIATCLMLTNLTWFFTFNDYLNALMLPVFFGFLVAIARIKSLLSRYFVLGSLLVISGGAVVVAAGLQGVPAYRVTFYFQLGVLLEVFVFALGLSVRFRLNQQKVQQAQQELIEQLRQNEELQANHAQELEETVEQRTAQLQNAYDSITDSVQYAQRIQQSMLAHPQEIAQHFGDCFILFKPKDIVSGDFYWFAQHQQSLVIAAVDCTGHGVPGAFMTIMGNDFLNEIVQSQHLTKPADILTELDKKITQNLKKQTGQADVNDGMDMAVLTINYAENTLQYAGAKNPLWQVSNGQMNVVKASKFPIGSAQYLEDKVFDNHLLSLQKGDVLYLFSDGFQDQFGGSHDKKYMKKRFREFLLSISHLPLDKQYQTLMQEFEKWKQSQPQTDDVLVIGIQV